jgi:membrane-bound lytic murein transglycosylase D
MRIKKRATQIYLFSLMAGATGCATRSDENLSLTIQDVNESKQISKPIPVASQMDSKKVTDNPVPVKPYQDSKDELVKVEYDHGTLSSNVTSINREIPIILETEEELIQKSSDDTIISSTNESEEIDTGIDLSELEEFSELSNLPLEQRFPFCDGSIYLLTWESEFSQKWNSENKAKYSNAKQREAAYEEAKNSALVRLLSPVSDQAQFDFPVTITEDVVKWITYFQTKGRRHFVTWLKRAEFVLPEIRGTLKSQGLPEDLAYLAMIESGFNNRALSVARAAGPWQFMRGTAKNYGLKINDFVDERRDLTKSTAAAARYLSDLYEMFGDWYLATASYNAGEGRVKKAQKKGNGKDFFSLSETKSIPTETRNYVPKLIAAMIMAKNPEQFGFEMQRLTENDRPPISRVEIKKFTNLFSIADATGTSVQELSYLNPELRTQVIPAGYKLKIKENDAEVLMSKMDDLPSANMRQVVRTSVPNSTTLSKFAERSGVNVKSLIEINPGLTKSTKLQKGQSINLPITLGNGLLDKLTASDTRPKLKKHKSSKHSFAKRYKKSKRIARNSRRTPSI